MNETLSSRDLERKHILDMLDEGKITAAEAVSLLKQCQDAKCPKQQFNRLKKDAGDVVKDTAGKIADGVRCASRAVAEKTADVVDIISEKLNDVVYGEDNES
jgi:hypothetical protein